MIRVLAFDLGASNGRAMLGELDGDSLRMRVLYRFDNRPIHEGGHLCWDIPSLLARMRMGLRACAEQGYGDIASISLDTWGVDFALLDGKGVLMGNPVHYRDPRTHGMPELADQLVGLDELYRQSGLPHMFYNTSFQLLGMKSSGDESLNRAHTLLMMPDLLRFLLTGTVSCEYTSASTSQLLNPHTRDWNLPLIRALGLPEHIFLPVTGSFSAAGTLKPEYADEAGLKRNIPVITGAGHDTACAVAAVPFWDRNREAFLSCGTWSLMGAELNEPVITSATMTAGFGNEGGAGGRIRFLTSIAGLWLLQECRRCWAEQGHTYEYADLIRLARKLSGFESTIDPNNPAFAGEGGDMPALIAAECLRAGQAAPASAGQTTLCILQSLAAKYASTLSAMEVLLGHGLDTLHIVGGGARNALLAELTAQASGKNVLTGPAEATATGNVLVQLVALGALPSMEAGRRLIAGMEEEDA
jgi:rhamnulokinase